jgi:hypothetical protein
MIREIYLMRPARQVRIGMPEFDWKRNRLSQKRKLNGARLRGALRHT